VLSVLDAEVEEGRNRSLMGMSVRPWYEEESRQAKNSSLISQYSVMIVGTRQIYCRKKIPVILKYSVIIIRTPWINLIYMLGQSY
jgi:hypothetical protein